MLFTTQRISTLLAAILFLSVTSAWISSTPSSTTPSRRRNYASSSARLSSTTPSQLSMSTLLYMSSPATTAAAAADQTIVGRSTLTLLEHININIPSHDHLAFYYNVLDLGLDPRKASNLLKDAPKKTVWANAGVSQLHLPFGETAQVIPGHVGLVFDSLDGLRARLQDYSTAYQNALDTIDERSGSPVIQITDHYGNVFHCRAQQSLIMADADRSFQPQPFIRVADNAQWTNEICQRFGKTKNSTDCNGISYIEFKCPVGAAAAIADFYRQVLGATASVLEDDSNDATAATTAIAIIAIGQIDNTGRSGQALVFRETFEPLPPYDGHHVALYIGESAADFEAAFQNCHDAGVVWVNPRFSDKADTLESAREYKQFRFKDIYDLATGHKVFELEHEMRSIEHECWTGAARL